jgi:glutaminase
MKMKFASLFACALVLALFSLPAQAQNCRQKKSVSECMACVQQSGHAGQSGGYNFCTGKTNKSGKDEKR